MTYRSTLAAVALLALAGAAHAEGVQEAQGQTIDLGSMSGTAYYMVRPDGYHVIATFTDVHSGAPFRMEGILAAGQNMVLSTPGGRSGPPHRVEIIRTNDEVFVHPVTLTN